MIRYKQIKDKDISSFIRRLAEKHIIVGPVKKEDYVIFDYITEDKEVELSYSYTMIPPKKFFFPPEEIMMEFENSEINEKLLSKEILLVGVHACDINGFIVLDKMFSLKNNDVYYLNRRKKSLIIGIDCQNPPETCFCKSMETCQARRGYDVFLRKMEGGYCAFIATNSGEKLTSFLFEDIEPSTAKRVEEESLNRLKDKVSISVRGLPERMDLSFSDMEIWEDIGRRCLGCGNCTMVCPVCNCFNVIDLINPDGKGGKRVRTWDACTLPGFAVVAGGINFRPGSTTPRIRNWFYDKFQLFPNQIGLMGCVGCGRCVIYCPARIDVREEINKIRRKYH